MLNKKLISTALSALTIFPTVAPLVSANGSQSDAQPQPSATAPSSAPDAADTDTIPPAQKRPHQAEPQADTAAKADSESAPKRSRLRFSSLNLQKAYDSLQTVDEFTNRFRDNAAYSADYINSFISPNGFSEPMDKLYTILSKLIVCLNEVYYNTICSQEERASLQEDVDNTLARLQTTILNALKDYITRSESLNEEYEHLQQNILRGVNLSAINIDLFSTLINHPQIKSRAIFPYLYSYYLINTTMQNIRAYFYDRMWWESIFSTGNIDSDFAREDLTKRLSDRLKATHSSMFSEVHCTDSRVFSYSTSLKKIFNLEISKDTDLDIKPNILIDILEHINDPLQFKTPNPCRNFIKSYLNTICCYCPIYSGNLSLILKLREVNTNVFHKIEKENFDRVPGLKDAFRDIGEDFENRESLFDSNLSPDEYYKNFTYRILTSESPRFTENPALRERLYKLSVLANIMICIQNAPSKHGLQPLLEELISKLKNDVKAELAYSSSGMPSISQLLPDFDFGCFPCNLFVHSKFFDILQTEPTPMFLSVFTGRHTQIR